MTPTRTIVVVGTGAFVSEDPYGPGVVARSVAQWCSRNSGDRPWRIVFLYRSEAGECRILNTWKSIRSEIKEVPEPRLVSVESDQAIQEIRKAHALLICVPDAVHAKFLEIGISSRVPIWIVKPLTANGDTSNAVSKAAIDRHVPIWVDYHKRFDVSNRAMRSAAIGGEYGAPLLFSVRYSQPRDLPLEHFSWARETDVFSYIGCHYVDQLMYVMPGFEVFQATATGIPGPVYERFGGLAWDTVLARIEGRWCGRPITAQFEVGWSNPLGSPTKSLQVVELSFERGRLFMDQTRRGIETWSDANVSVPNPYFFSRIFDPLTGNSAYQGYGYDSIRYFLDFTIASQAEQSLALANVALPWARSAARVDAVLDLVRDSLSRFTLGPTSGKNATGSTHGSLGQGAIEL